jgi:hypothetical protein
MKRPFHTNLSLSLSLSLSLHPCTYSCTRPFSNQFFVLKV